MGIAEGLALHQYVNELPRKEEEAKLKAQLFKSQADHLNAQTGLLQSQLAQEQAFQAGLPQALAAPSATATLAAPSAIPPVPPDLASQPAGPNPGAPTIGQLHTTDAFADPDSQQMQRMSGLAMRTGNMKHFATLQQGLLEMQKVKLQQRTQGLQDQLAFYQNVDAGLPDVPVNADKKAQLKQAKVSTMFQMGKTQDAMDMLGGKVQVVPPAGTAIRTAPGGASEEIYRSPVSPAELERQKQLGRQEAELPSGTPLPRAMPLRRGQGRSGSPAPLTDAPAEVYQRVTEIMKANPGMPEEEAVRQALTQLGGTSVGNGPGGESFLVRKKRLETQTMQDVEAGQPGATAGTVQAVKERGALAGQTGIPGATLETAAAQRTRGGAAGEGLQVGPGAKSVQEQKDEIAQRTQALPSSEVDKLAPLLDVRSYLEELHGIPEAKMKGYVGLLRGPLAKVQQVVTDTLEGAGKGDPDLHKFLSIVNQIFYTANRPDTGANFSGVEKEMINGIYATGQERSYTEFKQKVDRLDKTLEMRIGNRTALTKATRGGVEKVMQKPTEGTTTPTQETPQQMYERKKKELGL